jgi:hypothetical protein
MQSVVLPGLSVAPPGLSLEPPCLFVEPPWSSMVIRDHRWSSVMHRGLCTVCHGGSTIRPGSPRSLSIQRTGLTVGLGRDSGTEALRKNKYFKILKIVLVKKKGKFHQNVYENNFTSCSIVF